MAGKSKFQISKKLNEKIQSIVDGSHTLSGDSRDLNTCYIIGFHYSNVTNYIGLVNSHDSLYTSSPIVGFAFFRGQPSLDDIEQSIKKVEDTETRFECDKNTDLFIVYYYDDDAKQLMKKIFDSKVGDFLVDQPKLSILEENKLMAHCPLASVELPIKLKICDSSAKVLQTEEINHELKHAITFLEENSKDIKVHLVGSNFSSTLIQKDSINTESLYDSLDVPDDIAGSQDYLPQTNKAERQKLIDKWRNKIRCQRIPLAFKMEHEGLGFMDTSSLPPQEYGLIVQFYMHINAVDPLSKTFRTFVNLIKQQLSLLADLLKDRTGTSLEAGELRCCTFKPAETDHLIRCIYEIPTTHEPNFQKLSEIRRKVHCHHLLSCEKPLFRYSQRLRNLNRKSCDEEKGYLCDVHMGIADNSGLKNGLRNVLKGTYTYHHYLQDRASDSGWGCAYRSLQTIISWFRHQGYICSPDVPIRALKPSQGATMDKLDELKQLLNSTNRVPTHEEIQKVLVDVGDKQPNFVGSSKWIGSQEVCYVLSHLYDVDSKFISVSSGSELIYKARELGIHFSNHSTPVMIGGGVLAHTIIGIDFEEKSGGVRYLILDPHFTDQDDITTITKGGWCGWKSPDFWDKKAFYNLCLPQRPIEF